jgi:peptide/nickel transport system substrate-binding protein
MKRFRFTMLVGAALLAGAAAASAQTTLRIGLAEDPDVLDPTLARTFVGRVVFASLCDKLIDITPDLKLRPQLATEWSFSEDQKTLTMKLRQGVTFHDGEKFDAAAVKFNIERHLTLPGSYRKGEISAISGVEIVDDHTVKINLSSPFAPLLAQLTDRAGMMVSPKAAKALGDKFGASPVCSGPYKFVERVAQDRIVLERFPQYWNKDHYHFDRIVYLPITDATVRLANLQSGGLDMIERLAPTDIQAVKKDPKLKLASIVELGYQGITINVANGERAKSNPLSDPRVREALDLSIDREALNQVVFEGEFMPGNQWVPPTSPFYVKSVPLPKRDVARAKQLLKEAGKPHPSIEFMIPNDTIQQQVAQVIQAMAQEAGFDLKLRATEFASSLQLGEKGDYDAYLLAWSGRTDPDGNLYNFVVCNMPNNYSHYCNKSVDEEIEAARRVNGVEERMKHYRPVAETLLKDRPIIYIFHRKWLYGHTARLAGFTTYPDGLIRVADMKLQ